MTFIPLVSDRFPLSDLAAAVDRAVSPTPETFKILISVGD